MTALRLDWDDLRLFLAVVRSGSLRGAAEQLAVNHATINRAIKRLESELGTRIFDRSPSGLALSQPGELLVPHAETMEQQIFDLSRKVAGVDERPAGIVRVSLPHALSQEFISPIVAKFARAYPDIEIILQITNAISNLNRQEADVSIRAAYEVTDDVVGRRLIRYMATAYASPQYLDDVGSLELGDGAGATWIGWDTQNEPDWIATSPFPKAGVRHCFPEVHSQLGATAAGLGLAWLPSFLADMDPRIVRVPNVEAKPNRSIWLLLHSDLRKTARVRAFVDFVSAQILNEQSRYTA